MQGNFKAVANFENPKFDACVSGNGHRQSNKVNTIKNNPTKKKEINKYNLLPGKMVSVDQYILQSPVQLYHTKVKSDPSDMFSGGCVFF